jgi:hypothetical protein
MPGNMPAFVGVPPCGSTDAASPKPGPVVEESPVSGIVISSDGGAGEALEHPDTAMASTTMAVKHNVTVQFFNFIFVSLSCHNYHVLYVLRSSRLSAV